MKKTKLKFIFILLISLITLIPINNIKAITLEEETIGGVTRKKVKASYKKGDYSALVKHLQSLDDSELLGDKKISNTSYMSSGIVSTHAMSVTIQGKTIDAYCAWYENKSPEQDSEPITFYSLTEQEFPEKYAVGVQKIIDYNLSVCNEYADANKYKNKYYVEVFSTGKYSHAINVGDCERAMKTTAINLYLSREDVTAGKSCSGDSSGNRFDGAMEWNELEIFYNNGIDDPDEMYEAYKGSPNKYWKAIAAMVDAAESAQKSFESNPPRLSFVEDDKPFELSGSWYVKTYQVTSNFAINSLTATVSGLNSDDYKVEKVKNTNNKIKVSIKKDIYETKQKDETIKDVKVEAKAKINISKTYIFTPNTANRCTYQDLLFVLKGEDSKPVEITTEIPPTIQKKCYRYKKTCDTTACTNNKNNTRTCKSEIEEYTAETCDKNDNKNHWLGTKTYSYKGCNLYCKEEATVSYPGNLLDPISIDKNTNFVWPTPSANSNYPLTTTGTLTCYAVANSGENSVQTCMAEINKNNKKFEYKNAETGTVIYNDLAKDVSVKVKGNCGTTQTDMDTTGKIIIKNTCTYSLENEYNALNSLTLKAIKVEKENYKKQNDGKVVLSSQPFLPLVNDKDQLKNLNNILLNKYSLQISNLSLGHKGQFTDELEKAPYVCHYKATDTIKICTGGCVCPPGTKHAGKKLSSLLKETNDNVGDANTCSDAIEKYCNTCEHGSCLCYDKDTGNAVDITSCLDAGFDFSTCALDNNCVQHNLVCPEMFKGKKTDFKGKTIECCLDLGYSYEDCVYKECYAVCPANSDSPGKDIKGCIKRTKSKTVDEYEAYYLCIAEECYGPCPPGKCPPDDDPEGGDIIYRTISLEKPFIGKTASKKTTRESLYSISDFNVKGGALEIYRRPGNNWNSPTVVYNKIWNNRGYKASEIYNEATPLYTINLDPTSIKQIREYNEKNKYDDFKLTCTNGAYCISEFVHSTLTKMKNADNSSVLSQTGSTCYNASNESTFESCYTTKKVGNK